MRQLTGPIRTYAWGSRTALAALQGRPVPSADPEAELWLGAHPSAPAVVGGGRPLAELLAADPVGALGEPVLERFGPRLPYLLKVLAAAAPLSLQVHPDAEQARTGFAAEIGRPVGTVRRYVDPYHKPEVLVAVEEFDALCGFRPPAGSAKLLASFEVPALDPIIAALTNRSESDALRGAVELIMRLPSAQREPLVTAVVDSARQRVASTAPAFALAVRLGELYPGDVGVVLALLLNQVRLSPDEALFIPAGNLHAYVEGVGVELMAASDNVLRGGLTPKHVDVPELLRVLRYGVLLDPVLRPDEVAPGVLGWATPAAEFSLVKGVVPGVLAAEAGPAAAGLSGAEAGPAAAGVSGAEAGPGSVGVSGAEAGPGSAGVSGAEAGPAAAGVSGAEAGLGSVPVRLPGSGPRILVCTAGIARCQSGRSELRLRAGEAAFVAAGEPPVEVIAGSARQAVVFQASPGV
jgi:mannose-6-phosphate isomerase